ncbi:MAG TPA: selenoneine biosynthesis selenosugar synthase SenB [Gemmataceae bacterium]|jgi:putative glycosyltransferase (TIGR04348 family)
MRICLVTPAPPRSRKGNRITALRWARLLRSLGHCVHIAEEYRNQRCDLLVALHAGRSAASIVRFREIHPSAPLVLALTGTDVYGDIHTSAEARRSLELADRLVILQPRAADELPPALRSRARVIYQSVSSTQFRATPRRHVFEVCVLGHLRPVKDPFRTAEAARLLPADSRIRVVQIGSALSDDMGGHARAEEADNPRYRWLGELPRWKALRVLARCRLLALTSQLEGGANVISEALAVDVPVVSSRIYGSIGLLGADYPGYFPYGDTAALADLLRRCETDTAFYKALRSWCARLKKWIDPERERQSWRELLEELKSD